MDMTKVILDVYDLLHLIEIINWCNENNIKVPDYHHNGFVKDIGNTRFMFEQDEDAVIFALRWS
jgi:hypothetical protein